MQAFEQLKQCITNKDFNKLLLLCSSVEGEERLALLEKLQHSGWGLVEVLSKKGEKTWNVPNGAIEEFEWALFLLTRSAKEYQALPFYKENKILAYKLDFLLSGTDVHSLKMGKKSYFEEVVKHHKYHFLGELYTLLKPKEKELVGFEVHWTLYKGGVIPFDERLFTIHITAPYLRDDKVARYTDLVLSDQEFHEKIFRRLHLFENQMCHDTRAWEAFFIHLQKKGYVFTRSYITELFGTLLNPWKKTQLNWHCRWIEFLQPTQKELLAHQPILFALLSSGNSSLINFAIKHIQKITNEPNFDFATFTECFPLCFATQKIAKSQLIGLNILEKHYKQQPPTNLNYRESLAVLFTVPDTKLQEKVATILTSYFSDEGLTEVVIPYGEINAMYAPMQVIADEQLPIYHGGWLYVAVALLFEKSASRNLAADYIIKRLQTSANLNVLAHLLGKLLAENFAPISRFVEFLNIPTKDPKIKTFQKSVVEEYLHLVKDVAKKPTNHKKMVDFSLR